MRLHTADNNHLDVKPDGLTAILTLWSEGKAARSVLLYETEINWVIKELMVCKDKIKRKAGQKAKPPSGVGVDIELLP